MALVTGHAGDAPEDEPWIEGIFKSREDAKVSLRKSGIMADDS
jgi:hypothetical protein